VAAFGVFLPVLDEPTAPSIQLGSMFVANSWTCRRGDRYRGQSRHSRKARKCRLMTQLRHRGRCCFAMHTLRDTSEGGSPNSRAPRTGDHGISAAHSGLRPANFTTLPHFSVSSTRSFPKSAGEPARTVTPKSANRTLIFGSAKAAAISL
jgi:hypothetical protein